MSTFKISSKKTTRRAGAFALAALLACSMSFPQLAFATVKVDSTELVQGDNTVGGGTATLKDSALTMVNVVADNLSTDEDLSINFNGGNDIENTIVEGSAKVEMNFNGCNEVEDIVAYDSSDVTINANGHDELEEVAAMDDANVTINVTGENNFEFIGGFDNANITIRGTDCQKRDIINVGEDEDNSYIRVEKGNLTIDHVTVNMVGESGFVGSDEGNVVIDTSKIGKGDNNKYIDIFAGGTMLIRESVIDITGTVHSKGQMTINHSDVKADKPDSKYDKRPYRVYSETGIELINEKNGEVEKGEIDGKKVWYVDTDDNDGEEVDLKANGQPAYYKCNSSAMLRAMPKTADGIDQLWLMVASMVSLVAAAFALRRNQRESLSVATTTATERFHGENEPANEGKRPWRSTIQTDPTQGRSLLRKMRNRIHARLT